MEHNYSKSKSCNEAWKEELAICQNEIPVPWNPIRYNNVGTLSYHINNKRTSNVPSCVKAGRAIHDVSSLFDS
jgi:hypothetical protein